MSSPLPWTLSRAVRAMRRLNKIDEPSVLSTEGPGWTTRFISEQAAGHTKFSPWRNATIVRLLVQETFGKCAYCEGIIADVAPPNVEHILPKSTRPDLVVHWPNLTLACPNCNTFKRDYYSVTAPLLNPYQDDPEEHLDFLGPLILGRPGDDLGERTVAKLRLATRGELLIERSKRIQSLAALIDKWTRAEDPDVKSIFAEEIGDALADDAEFVGTLRAYAKYKGFNVQFGGRLGVNINEDQLTQADT